MTSKGFAVKAAALAAVCWSLETGVGLTQQALANGSQADRTQQADGLADPQAELTAQDGPGFDGPPPPDGPAPDDMGGPGPDGPRMGMGMPGGPGGMGPGMQRPSATMIPAKALQVLLGLSDDQTQKIAALQEQGRPGPQGRPAGHKSGRTGRSAILAVLTDAQKAQLPQVNDQACALRAAHVPLEALPDLHLSTDQLSKLAAIGADGDKKIKAAMSADADTGEQDGPPDAGMREAHEAMGEDVVRLLSDDQLAQVRTARRKYAPGPEGRMGPPDGGGFGRPGGMMPPPPQGTGWTGRPGGRQSAIWGSGPHGQRGPGGQGAGWNAGPDAGPNAGGAWGPADAPAGPPPADGDGDGDAPSVAS